MNRRDFHRTLIAGAGMAAMPAWANLLPTPEDMLCGHELRPGLSCTRERGHEWEHRTYRRIEDGSGVLKIYEWNDDREIWQRMDRGRILNENPKNARFVNALAAYMEENARRCLWAGAVFELRTPPLPVDPLTVHDWGIAWYWQPAPHEIPRGFNPAGRTMVQSGFFRVPPLEGFPRSGYNVFARLRA